MHNGAELNVYRQEYFRFCCSFIIICSWLIIISYLRYWWGPTTPKHHLFFFIQEFLKKEFSAENIYFWTACERYRRLPVGTERSTEAQRIYRQHLCVGAPEPVNVDCQGRQCTEQSLHEADSTLFDQAQKQIFNLMKFDSYPRFLKSDLYKQVRGCIIYSIKLELLRQLIICFRAIMQSRARL